MIYAPRMLLIGSTGRNAGKTVLAAALIRKFHAVVPIVGAKVTAIAARDGQCPRGGKGCGVCSSLEGEYCITREEEGVEGKDTQRLIRAGAQRVYWLRVLKAHIEEGARALMDEIGEDAWVVCESNSLRTVLKPGLFVMVSAAGSASVKPSAAQVYGDIDLSVSFDGEGFNFDLDKFTLTEDRWAVSKNIG
jgi:hypothetical protein